MKGDLPRCEVEGSLWSHTPKEVPHHVACWTGSESQAFGCLPRGRGGGGSGAALGGSRPGGAEPAGGGEGGGWSDRGWGGRSGEPRSVCALHTVLCGRGGGGPRGSAG